MSRDDKINVLIFVLLVIFLAVVVPARLRENEDAELGRAARELMEPARQ